MTATNIIECSLCARAMVSALEGVFYYLCFTIIPRGRYYYYYYFHLQIRKPKLRELKTTSGRHRRAHV